MRKRNENSADGFHNSVSPKVTEGSVAEFDQATSHLKCRVLHVCSCKHHCTFKVLISIAPTGAIIHDSDFYEVSI
jgi:hypothetical protein